MYCCGCVCVFSQCASRKVSTSPWAMLAPRSLAVMRPFLSSCLTTWTIFSWLTKSSSWLFRCSADIKTSSCGWSICGWCLLDCGYKLIRQSTPLINTSEQLTAPEKKKWNDHHIYTCETTARRNSNQVETLLVKLGYTSFPRAFSDHNARCALLISFGLNESTNHVLTLWQACSSGRKKKGSLAAVGNTGQYLMTEITDKEGILSSASGSLNINTYLTLNDLL